VEKNDGFGNPVKVCVVVGEHFVKLHARMHISLFVVGTRRLVAWNVHVQWITPSFWTCVIYWTTWSSTIHSVN